MVGPAASGSWWADRLGSIAIVVPASFVIGALTPIGQLMLPAAISSVANSSGGWSVVAFALVWAARCRAWVGIVLGASSFLLLNAGYAAMSAIRGYTWSMGLDNFFVLVGFVVGSFVGLAAAWIRSRSVWLVAVASALIPVILIGEGVYGLTVIASTTNPVYWSLSIAGGILFLVAVSRMRLRSVGPVVLAAALTIVGAAVFPLVYSSF